MMLAANAGGVVVNVQAELPIVRSESGSTIISLTHPRAGSAGSNCRYQASGLAASQPEVQLIDNFTQRGTAAWRISRKRVVAPS
jgi:hypothetical protein